MNEHTCPVCGYQGLELPPRDYSICASCGTEFGFDDRVISHRALRLAWIRRGCPWFDIGEAHPANWDPFQQLANAGFGADLMALMRVAETSARVGAVPMVYANA